MSKPGSYKRHRFPPEIIAYAVWLYFRFPLSLRLIEEMLLERGIVVSYETVRRWALKFGPAYARRLRRKTPSRRDIWHLDEVVVTIAGQKHWLWRAVDQDGWLRRKFGKEARKGRGSVVRSGCEQIELLYQ
jgi:putative transposase